MVVRVRRVAGRPDLNCYEVLKPYWNNGDWNEHGKRYTAKGMVSLLDCSEFDFVLGEGVQGDIVEIVDILTERGMNYLRSRGREIPRGFGLLKD